MNNFINNKVAEFDNFPSPLGMKVTGIVLNKEKGWSRELDKVLQAFLKSSLEGLVEEIEKTVAPECDCLKTFKCLCDLRYGCPHCKISPFQIQQLLKSYKQSL